MGCFFRRTGCKHIQYRRRSSAWPYGGERYAGNASLGGPIRWPCRVALVMLAVVAAGWPPGVARAAPALTITPTSSPCTGQVVLEGTGFAPGIRVGLVARATAPPSGQGVEFAALTVAADGAFRMATTVETIVPACRTATPPPDGTVYTIYVSTPPLVDKTGTGPEVLLTTATFTLGTAIPGLPNTGGGGARLAGVVPYTAALALGGLLVLVAGGVAGGRRRVR